jgi:glucosamine--fructose-6-phosphate aminotransferase (isomerizing)
MKAGPEIGVASTKAFTSMLLNLYLLTLGVSQKKGILPSEKWLQILGNLKKLPTQMDQILSQENAIAQEASSYKDSAHCLFVGRGPLSGIALEGALKLKEISYIHAEGYAGGELKHGPIALIDQHMPVIALVAQDRFREKMLSNIEEIKARQGKILGVGPHQDDALIRLCDQYIPCPSNSDSLLQAILSVIPLQIFSYYVALYRGTDVDQPRNLAKSVTVE